MKSSEKDSAKGVLRALDLFENRPDQVGEPLPFWLRYPLLTLLLVVAAAAFILRYYVFPRW